MQAVHLYIIWCFFTMTMVWFQQIRLHQPLMLWIHASTGPLAAGVSHIWTGDFAEVRTGHEVILFLIIQLKMCSGIKTKRRPLRLQKVGLEARVMRLITI